MNILTFDIEEWFHCDFISDMSTWTKYETRIFESVDKILHLLDERKIKATFFILGWIAEKYPAVVQTIHNHGHEIGCHSLSHNLVHQMDHNTFYHNTEKAIKLIEDIIGEKIIMYRAPGFSITHNTPWAFEVLHRLGIQIDCSVFPADHDYGGFPNFGISNPSRIKYNGFELKEFPMNTRKIFHTNVVFSGGGFFRLIPLPLINKWTNQSDYVMSYFHPRDFDHGQPILPQLSLKRKFKSYYGLKRSFNKFEMWLDNFETISILQADIQIDWENTKIVKLG
ncbi:polysaccharide deacetylase family protein [uncultured Draconibacterium sp.]|uniref:polysaccharide deacetylase family protein n=1 Tax=uncultured Draconibacterium sp. TaxID=1573823 RepID=UPI0029C981B2|nr:polysaccharide deacetylase family protein [uncultured Draconibacterium sp.]